MASEHSRALIPAEPDACKFSADDLPLLEEPLPLPVRRPSGAPTTRMARLWAAFSDWRQERRCQRSRHFFIDWKCVQENRRIYESTSRASETERPIAIENVYLGHCRYCGAPGSRKVRL